LNDLYSPRIKKQIVTLILEYPSLFKSHLDVLNHMLIGYGTGYEWENGSLKKEKFYYKKPERRHKEECLGKKVAEKVYLYGYQEHFTKFHNFSKLYSPIFNIPENIKNDWLVVIKDFVYEINKIDMEAYRIQLLANCIKWYRIDNPQAYEWFSRDWNEFKELREYTNQLAKDRGWMSADEIHNPKNKARVRAKMSKLIQGILDKVEKEDGSI
jgi:hypothetical protein